MRIVVIDDDLVFTEPLVWRLDREGHDVVYCQTVSQVLDGWFELTEQSLESLRREGFTDSMVEKLREFASQRFDTIEVLEDRVRNLLGSEEVPEDLGQIEQRAHQDPLIPAPDCIVLDLMMPRGTRYTKGETDAGRSTGMVLLRDVLKKIKPVPVIVLTVRDEPEVHAEVRKRFGEVVKRILVKPVSAAEVLKAIDDAWGITATES